MFVCEIELLNELFSDSINVPRNFIAGSAMFSSAATSVDVNEQTALPIADGNKVYRYI